MLIAATHTHSAPAAMGCLGSRADREYQQQLVGGIAHSIVRAARRLVAVRVGWTVASDPAHNHCRRWILRPDRLAEDPFGGRTVRANMHPGHRSPDHIGPAGPADTALTLLGVQTMRGKPLAYVANYAMHHYGSTPVSADFCGAFSRQFAEQFDGAPGDRQVVAMMSQGTSGDSMWTTAGQ